MQAFQPSAEKRHVGVNNRNQPAGLAQAGFCNNDVRMHNPTFLTDVLILLIAAVFIVVLFRHLRMSPVLGYLVAGASIGPYGLSIIKAPEITGNIAEIGVVFLLFLIGLELSFDRLRDMRRYMFGVGGLQVAITGAVIANIAGLFIENRAAAIIVGLGIAMSSTSVVLQVLHERREQASQPGRLALSVLILQDFAVVPLLVLIPLLSSGTAGAELLPQIGLVLFKAMVALLVIFVAGRLFLRPMFRLVAEAHSPEIFAAATLLVVLGLSFVTNMFGLSMALGAFLAGLLLAETEYEHQVEADILPFKGLFLGLFFMSVGMSVDIGFIIDNLGIFLLASACLIIIKAIIIIAICRFYGIRQGNAFETGFLLAQGGEFAFVILNMLAGQSLMTLEQSQALMVVITITMAVTPLMAAMGRKLGDMAEGRKPQTGSTAKSETADLANHVIMVGFGRKGQMLARLLTEEKIPFVAIDMDPHNVAVARKKMLPVYYGDATRPEVLQAIGVERADMVVFTSALLKSVERPIRSIRTLFPELTIIARSATRQTADELRAAGANVVVEENLESGLQLGAALLRTRGTAPYEVQRVIEHLRHAEAQN